MTLKDDYEKRVDWFNNRSSAIFPIHVSSSSDVRLTFLNYWKQRNFPGPVRCNLRVYEGSGTLAAFESFIVESMHNDISVSRLVKNETYSGTIEIEFISAENLRYPFPAVTAWYVNDFAVSAVHSAGRLKNSNEPIRSRKQIETNWTCILNGQSEPFFHIFNGNLAKPNGLKAKVTAHSGNDGRPLVARTFNTGIGSPFASRLFHLSNCFSSAVMRKLEEGEFFIGVELEHAEIFPRLVVGNYCIDIDHYAVTHSYPWLSDAADVVDNDDGNVSNMLIMVTNEDIDLTATAFPTNVSAHVTASQRSAARNGVFTPRTNKTVSWRTGGDGAGIRKFAISELSGIFEIRGCCPARINANYRYSVKGASSCHATDIAGQFKSAHCPPKHSHWGTGMLGGGFDTALMLSNCSWDQQSKQSEGVLKIFSADQVFEKPVSIGPESAQSISLINIVDVVSPQQTVSWFLNMDQPTCGAFWISYHPDGRICGDHAF
jgi:hypothetical protein